ncbi:MAG: hypothetical protein LBT89_06610 [Planctomycetaceae bacterium]|jgi:hypothetical protein|nr:hypothetical protein [Planctomycetaceae bacterium]
MQEFFEIIYEISDSIDNRFVLDTTDKDTASEYYRQGFLVDEHRIYRFFVTSNQYTTVTHNINWQIAEKTE